MDTILVGQPSGDHNKSRVVLAHLAVEPVSCLPRYLSSPVGKRCQQPGVATPAKPIASSTVK
ncbi:MAG: hypothetical protein CMJ59_00325 [Planctomycetaceae bacterium]|nr:hypothetical protein [Planctomycetaceae bacterium]